MFRTNRMLLVAGVAVASWGCAPTSDAPDAAKSSPGAGGGADGEIVARVGDHTITLADVDEKAKETNVQPYQALYDARKQALQTLVSEHLLDTEAAKRGTTRDGLIDVEINQKATRPTAEQIQAFYEQNKARMGGKPLEEMSPQIQNYLTASSRQQAMSSLLENLRDQSRVSVSLEPPRVPVTIAANDPVKGPAGAPIQIVEFSDFQ